MRAGVSEFGGRRPPEPSAAGAALGASPKEGTALPEHHGAMLAEMGRLGLPVKPGFCVSADCVASEPESVGLWEAVEPAIVRLGRATSRAWGLQHRPLLLSVRASGRAPGCVVYLGLNDAIVEAQAALEGAHFAWDSYRELILSYSSVVRRLDMGPFEERMQELLARLDAKCQLGRRHSTCDVPSADLKVLVAAYKGLYAEQTGHGFPQDPSALLLDALRAACEAGPDQAAVVQAMAFGNYDATSGTGWALLGARRAAGEGLRGGWRPRVAGSCALAAAPAGGPAAEGELGCRAEADREPLPDQAEHRPPPLGDALPGAFRELAAAGRALEERFGGVLGSGGALRLDFAVQQGKLWAVACRAAAAGGPAAPGGCPAVFAPRGRPAAGPPCGPGAAPAGCGWPASAGTAQPPLPLLARAASAPALCPPREAAAGRPTSSKGGAALRLPALPPAAAPAASPSLLESRRGVDRGRRKVGFIDRVSYCPELPE